MSWRCNSISFIMRPLVRWGVVALVVLFQPEIRRLLEEVGSRRFVAFFSQTEAGTHWSRPSARRCWPARRCPRPAPAP